mmetsp:Transcript_7354/g.11524  ORF Transcript_7354/g.11524 Transcript_7354/m.11524 type:complete len:100 (+) Transcript_7354:3313-3612(+)
MDTWQEHNSLRLGINLILIYLAIMSFVKGLQYLRYLDQFGFLVEMILQVFSDLLPFLAIFFLANGFFALIFVIMDAQVEGAADDYPSNLQMFPQAIVLI